MNTLKIITGVLISATAGAVLGILFAPEKGYKTRKTLLKKKDEMRNALGKRVNKFVDDLTEHYENIKGNTSKLFEEGKSKLALAKSEVKHSTGSNHHANSKQQAVS